VHAESGGLLRPWDVIHPGGGVKSLAEASRPGAPALPALRAALALWQGKLRWSVGTW
jgi:hypothetical protein